MVVILSIVIVFSHMNNSQRIPNPKDLEIVSLLKKMSFHRVNKIPIPIIISPLEPLRALHLYLEEVKVCTFNVYFV